MLNQEQSLQQSKTSQRAFNNYDNPSGWSAQRSFMGKVNECFLYLSSIIHFNNRVTSFLSHKCHSVLWRLVIGRECVNDYLNIIILYLHKSLYSKWFYNEILFSSVVKNHIAQSYFECMLHTLQRKDTKMEKQSNWEKRHLFDGVKLILFCL